MWIGALNFNTIVLAGAAYSWSGPNSFTSSLANPLISPLTLAATGTYSLTVSGSACISPIATQHISVVNISVPTIVAPNTLCQGDALILHGQSVDANVTYNWTGPNNFLSSGQTDTINPVDSINAGAYYLQTNYGQCKSPIDTFHITIIPSPIVSLFSDTSICVNDTLKIQAITSSQNNILWSTPKGIFNSVNPLILANLKVSNSGWYHTTVSSNGCKTADSINVNIYNNPSIIIDTACIEEQKILMVTSGYSFYLWNNGSNQDHVPIDSAGVYTVTVASNDGCSVKDSINIHVVKCIYCYFSNIFIPNTFTPNGDDNNDTLYIRAKGISEFYFAVYNRWGQMVFETSDILKGWDGNYKGMKADPAVFDWYVRAKCNGKEFQKKGNVTLVR